MSPLAVLTETKSFSLIIFPLETLTTIGIFPKEYKSKTIKIGDVFRESVDEVDVSQFKKYLLQKYVRVEADNDNYQVMDNEV